MSGHRSTVITFVHAPACHFCADAEQVLTALALDYPLVIDRVSADEDTGRALVAEHRAAMYPLVLVDGRFFSSGRLPRTKLRRLLEMRRTDGAVA